MSLNNNSSIIVSHPGASLSAILVSHLLLDLRNLKERPNTVISRSILTTVQMDAASMSSVVVLDSSPREPFTYSANNPTLPRNDHCGSVTDMETPLNREPHIFQIPGGGGGGGIPGIDAIGVHVDTSARCTMKYEEA